MDGRRMGKLFFVLGEKKCDGGADCIVENLVALQAG